MTTETPKPKKTLAEAAADIFKANLANKGWGEPFGATKGPLGAVPGQTGPGKKEEIVATPVDPDKSGITAAKNAAPTATPPGKAPHSDEQATRKDIHTGASPSGVKRATVDDNGVVKEDEDLEEGAKTDTTHEIESQVANDGTPSNDEAQSVSSRVKAYFKAKGAGLAVEDISAIFTGTELSEDFKTKATVVYEAAVITLATKICEGLEAEYVTQLEKITEAQKEQMTEHLNDYIGQLSEQWMKDNQLAVERSLRADISESFMKGLHNLFIEHYIDVPEDKADVFEQMAEHTDTLETKLDEATNKIIELTKIVNENEKSKVLASVTEGLKDIDAQKIKTLAEAVEFTNPTEFKSKIETLKGSYVKESVKVASVDSLNEEVAVEKKDADSDATPIVEEVATEVLDPRIAQYVNAISKTRLQ